MVETALGFEVARGPGDPSMKPPSGDGGNPLGQVDAPHFAEKPSMKPPSGDGGNDRRARRRLPSDLESPPSMKPPSGDDGNLEMAL